MNTSTPLAVDLDHAILALSDSLDFIGVDEIGHGHRVALMAATIARALDWEPDRDRVRDIVRAGLLHDCGVSSTLEHRHIVDELTWAGEQAHCERGFTYLSGVPSLAYLGPLVLEHHTKWSDLVRRNVVPEIAMAANLLHLCDRADAVHLHGLAEGKPIIDVLSRHMEVHFAPELMAAFTEEVARWLGTRFGYDAITLDVIEIAALLHDLGKLRVPDELLDKQGPLTAEERRRMARHAFDTYEMLRRIFGDGPVAQWAAFHHEYISGHGYPFHREGAELPTEARIIAVADVVQALAQKRPYRAPLSGDEIATILDGMVFAGKLDRGVVDMVKMDMEACRAEAVALEHAE